ncbi:MAG: Ig domain-containing protein [Acutalibacteraceae bacterium]|nr:Ig-like domain-containing protein [Oscillospiraceae bacterium]
MRKFLACLLTFTFLFAICAPVAYAGQKESESVLRLVVPEEWEMDIGDSRSVDAAFSDGVTDRVLTWTAEPESVATVDQWGRVTAVGEGKANITAKTAGGLCDTVVLNVVTEPTKLKSTKSKTDYQGEAVAETENLQKLVTRYAYGSKEVSEDLYDESKYASAQSVTSSDGAVWQITDYGVLRTDNNAANDRDKEQRFMGDRYFYSPDTGDGNVLAIFSDGDKGIWTVMKEGFTHIKVVEMNGEDKAALMSDDTQKNVSRRGMVSNAGLIDDEWIPEESDNDGLWTSMYGAGELMRYAVLRDDPTATEEEVEAARKTAYLSTEAVLLLTYISMREGTVDSYVRAQRNGSVTDLNTGKYYSSGALVEGGDYSQNVPFNSPATMFEYMQKQYMKPICKMTYVMDKNNLALYSPESWIDPLEDDTQTYAARKRNLEGFWARTYSLKSEKEEYGDYSGNIYWSMNGDGTATGVSTKTPDSSEYLINGENLRGKTVNATKAIPERLWNDLLGSDYQIDEIVYKGDTSADEIIGHLFIYKLAYDILGKEDPEIASLISQTMDLFAQHLVDNGYALCDGTGQPTTWGKFSRTYFHNGQVLGGAPLQSAVLLCAFKVAAYVTGDQKWENEYRMAALDPQYEYAKTLTQELERYTMSIIDYGNGVNKLVGLLMRPLVNTNLFKTIYRLILNDSDEEMAMLAYYLLFQLEDDEELLSYYREGVDDWWYSISHSENPLWYYIYQLAYPDREVTDYYGNNIIETASWSLSRHPIDMITYLASNKNRDDVAEIDLKDLGISGTNPLSYDATYKKPLFSNCNNKIIRIIGIVLSAGSLKWAVAAPDERALHKYNTVSYVLDGCYNVNNMEGSTTYTLPYWMGRYHGMLK